MKNEIQGKHGKFVYVVGRGYVYVIDKPKTLTHKKYNELKINRDIGLETEVLMTYPPFHRIRGIRVAEKTQRRLKNKQ